MAFLPLVLWSMPAHAEQHGLVVRLDSSGATFSGTVVVVLTPPTGEPTRLEVLDDGVAPDVAAGDGTWSSSLWLDGDAFTISVEASGKTLEGGPVSWNATDSARDLQVIVKGNSVVAEAGVSTGGGGEQQPGDAGAPRTTQEGGSGSASTASSAGPSTGPSPGSGSPSGPSAGPSSGPSSGPSGAPGGSGTPPLGNRTATTSSSNDGTLYIGFGIGVLLLVGVAWLWLRNRPPEGSARTGGLAVLPEPGLLGPGSPSLSDGLSLWLVPEADADALVRPLLATLARHHLVLFAAPVKVVPPAVHGGPVYRATNIRPSHVGDAAESLQREGRALAVLFVGTQADAATLKDYADLLPTGVGSICVLTQDPGVPALARVMAHRDNGAWSVQTAERTFRLVEARDGALEEPAA
ncbi:MAG: hypothetical protein Q8P18_34840 [Pseudomonadota bacterium]|nr:hypothetical protein [Pseudomonadota bacterium]